MVIDKQPVECAAFWKAEYCSLARAGVEEMAEMGVEVDPAEKMIEAAEYRESKLHKRESIAAAGDVFKSTDPDFPGWLIAVPLEQLKDMRSRFKKLVSLGQTHISKFETQSAEVSELKSAVFGEAEMGAMHAGNWTQHGPKSNGIEDQTTKEN